MPHFGLAHDLYITMGSLFIQEWLNQKKSYRNFFLLRLYLIVKRCQNAQTPNLQISKSVNFSENSLIFASTGIPMPRKSCSDGFINMTNGISLLAASFPSSPSLSHFLASFTHQLLLLLVTQKKVAIDKINLSNLAFTSSSSS